MFIDRNFKKISYILIPTILSFLFLIFKESINGNLVSVISVYIVFTTYFVVRNTNFSLRGYYLFNIFTFLMLFWFFEEIYFVAGSAFISVISYRVFEWLGEFVEKELNKVMPSLFPVLPKLCIWLFGCIFYLFILVLFFIGFIKSYQNHPISLLILRAESQSQMLSNFGLVILSLIIAVFILDFLIKMVKSDEYNLNLRSVSRIMLYKLFSKIALAIIFSDIAYSILYISFSGTEASKLLAQYSNIQNFDFIQWFRYNAQSFYYAFCLHFSIPLPTTEFFNDLDKAVKTLAHLQIIQFFHTCLNKIVDLTILGYTAGVILKALGFTTKSSEEEK